MAMRMVPVDAKAFKSVRYISTLTKGDGEGGQKLDAEDRPLFTVQVLVEVEGDETPAELINVTIPGDSGKVPGVGLNATQDVELPGLRVGAWTRNDRANWYFNADAVLPAKRAGSQAA